MSEGPNQVSRSGDEPRNDLVSSNGLDTCSQTDSGVAEYDSDSACSPIVELNGVGDTDAIYPENPGPFILHGVGGVGESGTQDQRRGNIDRVSPYMALDDDHFDEDKRRSPRDDGLS